MTHRDRVWYKVADGILRFIAMRSTITNMPTAISFHRCAGPNCGLLKNPNDRWWMMWTAIGEYNRPVLSLCRWDEDLALREGAVPVCGEQCVQRLQSQFMGNISHGESPKNAARKSV